MARKQSRKPSLNRPPLWIAWLLSITGFYLFPQLRLFYLGPVLAMSIQRFSLLTTLWIAALIGLLSDCFCYDCSFGLYALLTTLTALLGYRFQRWFYEDRIYSLPLFTGILSLFFFLLKSICLVTTPFWIPFLDMAYAFLWFSCPLFLYTLVFQRRYS